MSDRPVQFTDRLLEELLPLVGANHQPVPAPPVRDGWGLGGRAPRRTPVRRLAVLGCALLLAAAAVVTAAVFWPRALGSAYAVAPQPDGSVVVTVNDLSDPRGLERVLGSDDVPATVLLVDPGQSCAARADTVSAPGAVVGHPGQSNVVTIRPAAVPPGSRVVLGLFKGEDGQVVTLFVVVDGPAPSCFPGSAPVPTPR